MKIWFLEGAQPFTKTIERLPDGSIKKDPYPHLMKVSSMSEEISAIKPFFSSLKAHAAKNHCLLKGGLARHIKDESRRGLVNPDEPTEWACFDLDSLEGFDTVEDALDHFEVADIDHIVQYSASHSLGGRLSAHVFFLLDRPVSPQLLKQWFMSMNLDSPLLRPQIHLYRSKVAHSWPLDVSCAQNDKLIYIAPPIFRNMKDPVRERIVLVKGKRRHLEVPTQLPALASLKSRSRKLVAELRAKEGLPSPNVKLRIQSDGTELASGVEAAQTYELFDCGDYWRLNLNGGDSRGYWVAKSDPRIVRNFKGEPNYQTEQLLPQLYAELMGTARTHHTIENKTKGFVDEVINYNGQICSFYYDLETGEYKLTKLSGNTLWKHYLMERGVSALTYVIGEWNFAFEPMNPIQIDVETRFVNTFRETPYMRIAKVKKTPRIPRRIEILVRHVFGEEMTEHFLNWLAVIWQKRTRTSTAWLAHGIHGTGKGVLFHKVLKPMFGDSAIQVSQHHFMSRFNGFLDSKLLAMIDEVDFSTNDEIMRDVMNKITERSINIEQKFSPMRVIPNTLNFILASNRLNPVSLAITDRRFNVGVRQDTPLSHALPLNELEHIEDELNEFALYLVSREIDFDAAARPIMTEAKEQMQILSASALDEVCDMLIRGKLEYFMMQYVDPMTVSGNRNMIARDYQILLKAFLTDGSKDQNLSRDAIRIIVNHCVGSNEAGESKFTRMLAHHGIILKPMRPFNTSGVVRPCYPVGWKYTAEQRAQWLAVLGEESKPAELRRVK
jgi:Family of unknown function (DUF5906)